jgi:hypothetical protein
VYALDLQRLAGLRSTRWSGVGRNVYFLGATSLLTDLSSEMVAAVLPFYLAFALRLTPTQLAWSTVSTRAARRSPDWWAAGWPTAGGATARWRRPATPCRRPASWACWAPARPGVRSPASSRSTASARGLRTTPRDALISLSCAPERLGLAFGVHRAFDTAGALAGPLLAFALLAWLPGAYDVVFVASFGIARGRRGRAAAVRAQPPCADGSRGSAAAPDAARAGDLRGAAPPAWADLAALLREPALSRRRRGRLGAGAAHGGRLLLLPHAAAPHRARAAPVPAALRPAPRSRGCCWRCRPAGWPTASAGAPCSCSATACCWRPVPACSPRPPARSARWGRWGCSAPTYACAPTAC